MIDLLKLREALEASWDEQTSYRAVKQVGNPSLGQCYPTSWLIQQYFPEVEIIKGEVWNGTSEKAHFWNMIEIEGVRYYIDFTWQQFPPGSRVVSSRVLDRHNLGDGPSTVKRCSILKDRVEKYLLTKPQPDSKGI